jgi:hypothetical protein
MATKKIPNVYVLLRTIADFVEEVPIKDKCLKEKKEAALMALAILDEMFTPSVLAKKGDPCSCGGGLPVEKP